MTKAIINGILLTQRETIAGRTLLFGPSILEITEDAAPRADEVIDAQGQFVTPGLIDTHIHGYLGADASDGSEAGLVTMAEGLIKNGVTSFLPTTMTLPLPQIEEALAVIRRLMQKSRKASFRGAQILGCHVEGPFLNPLKKGAQAAEHILPPDASFIRRHADVIQMVTFAPEVPGGLAFARAVRDMGGVTLSLGHSTASYEEALQAFRAGVSQVTHLFNAMPALKHREPGAVGAALTEEVCCELIADTFHVHPSLFRLIHRAKGGRLVLVSDCIRAGGLGDGPTTLGGQQVSVRGNECRLADGTIAGSVLRLNDAVRQFRDHAGVTLREAVNAASIQPARCIGAEGAKGSLAKGKDADLLIMDQDCRILNAFVGGVQKYSKDAVP